VEIFSNNNLQKKGFGGGKLCAAIFIASLFVACFCYWCCCGCFALFRLCFLDIFGLMLITELLSHRGSPKQLKFLWRT